MEDTSAVAVAQTVHDLFEDGSGCLFIESLPLFDVLQEVTPARVFHDHQEVLRTLEDLQESDDTGVPDLF